MSYKFLGLSLSTKSLVVFPFTLLNCRNDIVPIYSILELMSVNCRVLPSFKHGPHKATFVPLSSNQRPRGSRCSVSSQLASYLSANSPVSCGHIDKTHHSQLHSSSFPNKPFLKISRKRVAGLGWRAGGWNIGGSQLST